MDWENERYVRVYTRDTVEWEMLPWESRALWPNLLRKVDRAGYLPLGRHGAKGLAALVKLPFELVVAPGLAGLLEDGCVMLIEGEDGETLFVRNFVAAQEARKSARLRKQEQREREAAARAHGVTFGDTSYPRVTNRDQPSQNVTPSHKTGPNVTGGHEPSQSVTPSLAVLNQIPPSPLAGGTLGEPHGPDDPEVRRVELRVLQRINELASTTYTSSPDLRARILEGATEEDLLAVVASQWARPFMHEQPGNFRPRTLFSRKNFAEYLGGARATPQPQRRAPEEDGYRVVEPEEAWGP